MNDNDGKKNKMTLSNLINSSSNSPKVKEIKILSSNGIDETTAIVLDEDNNDNKQNKSNNGKQYYQKNRSWILQKKKVYALKNKERIARYHRQYYLDHKEELNLKHRQWYRKNKINESSKMSRTRM